MTEYLKWREGELRMMQFRRDLFERLFVVKPRGPGMSLDLIDKIKWQPNDVQLRFLEKAFGVWPNRLIIRKRG